MSDPPRPTGRLPVPIEGGIKLLKKVPSSVWVLAGLGLAALGIFKVFAGLVPFLDDETKLHVVQVFLADLNGDDREDAFLVTNQMHRVVFNDGAGNFMLDRELLMYNYAFALGDLDGDGDLNAIVIGLGGGEEMLKCADLSSEYVFPNRSVSDPNQVFAIRDGNRDGVPEDFVAGCCSAGTIMANRATLFRNQRPCLASESASALAVADLNGDGALDVFLSRGWLRAEGATPNKVWFNDGMGNFTDSGQELGDSEGYAVAVGDLNGDGFPDVVVGNRGGGEIWFNDGQGGFSQGKQRLGSGMTHTAFLADLDDDSDLDLFLGGYTSLRAWLNDGGGRFKAGQRIPYGHREAVAVGDVTGDGVADIFVGGPDSYQVWRGDGNGRFSGGARSIYR